MQSWMALLVVGILIGPVTGPPAASADSPAPSVEVESVVNAAYETWHSSLGIRQECSAGAAIVFAAVDGRRGEYRTRTAEVVIDPYDKLSGMGSIVVHELSHHTFLTCGVFADQDFTTAFYASQDLPEDRDWFDYAAGWSTTPAEHFAEAMAITIYGSGEGGIAVSTETAALVSRWLAGAPSTPPAEIKDPTPYSPATGLPGDAGVADSGGEPPAQSEPAPPSEPTALIRSAVELATRASVSVFSLTNGRVLGPI